MTNSSLSGLRFSDIALAQEQVQEPAQCVPCEHEGVFAELCRHHQRAGRHAQTSSLHPVSHPAPGEIGATQEEHMARTHEREVGTSHIPSCFLLLKLHYLLQCKKYPESGEEYLIYNVSASCFVWFFSCLWQEADDNSISDLPIQYFVLPSNLIFILTTSPSMRFW